MTRSCDETSLWCSRLKRQSREERRRNNPRRSKAIRKIIKRAFLGCNFGKKWQRHYVLVLLGWHGRWTALGAFADKNGRHAEGRAEIFHTINLGVWEIYKARGIRKAGAANGAK